MCQNRLRATIQQKSVKPIALEQIMDLMDGVQFKFWTLNGSGSCAAYSCARRRHGGSATFQLSEFNDATQYRFPCCSRTNGRITRK